MLLANFNRKEHLRHRAVSLRQHGFLVCIVGLLHIASQYALCSYASIGKKDIGLYVSRSIAKMYRPLSEINESRQPRGPQLKTRSQAVARIADYTVLQQTIEQLGLMNCC